MRYSEILLGLILTLLLPTTGSAEENMCNAEAGKVISKSLSDTDGGTKPNARVTVKVEASPDYFILVSSIETDSVGTRKGSGSQLSVEPHPAVSGILEPIAAISATFQQSCKHRNIFGTSSCTAAGRIQAIEYPIKCLPDLVSRSFQED